MANQFTPQQADTFLTIAQSEGWKVKTEISTTGLFTLHSCTRDEPENQGGSFQVIFTVRHPRPGHRASVRVITHRINRYFATYRQRGRTGAREAWRALRDAKKSWEPRNA